MKVLVLGGGDSPEREVSLRSARAVHSALTNAGFDALPADPSDGLEVLDKLAPGTIIFPILHGLGGEDGTIQAELEKRNLPYLGTDSRASVNCFDKWTTREIFSKKGLAVADGALVTAETYPASKLIDRPHVLKVAHGGSSIGTLIVRKPHSADPAEIAGVFAMDKTAVLEELIEGVEVTVPILDKQALPVIEIRPPKGGEFDFENKYNGTTAEICPPQSVDSSLQKLCQELAEKAHAATGCRHLSRVDMIINHEGVPVLLEINTIPGLTDQSLYPKSAAAAGMPMPTLVEKFVRMVARDYKL